MSSFEIKIWRLNYNEPEGTKLYEAIVNFTIPDIDGENELIVLQCANEVAYVASGIIEEAVNSCGDINESCITNLQNVVALADEEVVETFHDCLRQSGIPEELIHICEVEVLVRESYI